MWVYDIRSDGPHHSFGRATAAALAWSSDSRWLAAGLDDGSVLVSEAGSENDPQRIRLSPSAVTAIAFHPAGQFLASGHANKRVLIFRFPTGERIYTFEAAVPPNPRFPQVIERVAFDGKGTRLASAHAEGEFSIWDTSALLQ